MTQVALAVVLVTTSAVFVGTFWKLEATDLGFDSSRVAVAQLVPAPANLAVAHPDTQTTHLVADAIAALPNVASACLTSTPPLAGVSRTAHLANRDEGRELPSVAYMAVSRGCIQTLGLSLREGRDFTRVANVDPIEATISQSIAGRFFDGDALGRTLELEIGGRPRTLTVIGVVGDAKLVTPRDEPTPMVYLNYDQMREFQQSPVLLARTLTDPETLVSTLSRTLTASQRASEYAVYVRSLTTQLDMHLTQEKLLGALASVFGLVALFLCAIGLFGLLTHMVMSRASEMAVRQTLGASPASVQALVVGEAIRVVIVGTVVGVVLTLSLAGPAADVLGYVGSINLSRPLMLAAAVLAVVSLASVWLPARRVTRLVVVDALRKA